MGVTFRIDPQEGMIYSLYQGEITLQVLQEASRCLRADPLFRPGLKDLVDARKAVPRLSADDMFQYAMWLQQITPIAFIAVLTRSDVGFGVARMFEQMFNDDSAKVRVFRDEAEARSWLAAQPVAGA